MGSIDLFNDFNEDDDILFGDREEVSDGENNAANAGSGNDGNKSDKDNSPTKQDVDPGIKVKKVKRKMFTLNAERLKGPRGIIAIDDFFQSVKLKGRGYERDDLNEIMKRLEHWQHRMYPKYHFDDALTTIEKLGRKKEVLVHMQRYRLDQLSKDDDQVLLDNEQDRPLEDSFANELPIDEFEDLINQQIALSTSHISSVSKLQSTTQDENVSFQNISGISASTQIPKPDFMPQSQEIRLSPSKTQLSEEMRAKIAENRERALAIRAARMKEALEEQRKESEAKTQEISNIIIDDDFV
jgi:TIMELESS-interacting protein